jgi:hypothetical protein
MKIVIGRPPIFDEVKKHFNFDEKVTVFTYGDTIYNPGNGFISDDLMVHESVHMDQQGNDPKSWWDKYLADCSFRLSQELEAYSKQWRFFKSRNKDRNAQMRFINGIASCLSSEMYGNIITKDEAIRKIKHG